MKEPAFFLSLGLFNVIAFCQSRRVADELCKFADDNNVLWERWLLNKARIKLAQFSPQRVDPIVAKPLDIESEAIRSSEREYRTILLSSLARAEIYAPKLAKDLRAFDVGFREVVSHCNSQDVSVSQGLLAIANAAISRHSSQTFAGTSPILQTECHYWTHSLLGVGIGSLAIRNIQRFIEGVVEKADLIGQVRALSGEQPLATPIERLISRDPFWDPPSIPVGYTGGSDKPRVPLVTCFSGRDGFRGTALSISAPLESITSCNTPNWTLQTLTHEATHALVEGFLAAVLPHPDKIEDVQKICAISPERPAPNRFEQVRAAFTYAVATLSAPDPTADYDLKPDQLAEDLRSTWPEANEILTHIVDFLYFYRSSPEAYVKAVWASWGVIPNIQQRVKHYVVRCLCALHTTNLRKESSVDLTLELFENCIRRAAEEFPDILYVRQALADIEADRRLPKNKQQFRLLLVQRVLLVKLARRFLFADGVAKLISTESASIGNATSSYAVRVGEFTGEPPIANPLRFVEEHSTDKKPDPQRSVWILQQLALAAVP